MQCQVDSLIPLLYAQQGSLEATVKEVVKTLEASVLGFETSAKRLLARYFADPELHHNIQRFIHGCQCACTANLNWRSVALHSRSLQDEVTNVEIVVSVRDDTSSVLDRCMAERRLFCELLIALSHFCPNTIP